ncbi:MAG: signal peptide peptidase SppA [PVC group bacterium]
MYVRKRRSVWPWIIAGALVVVLGGSLLISLAANVFLIRGAAEKASVKVGHDRFSEVVVEGEGADKIVLIPVEGFITFSDSQGFWKKESMGEQAVERLRAAQEDPAVKAVVLQIDSPGGGITASDIICHRVKELQKSGKKVVAVLGDLAASGGYYVAAPADCIVAHPTTVTGSIGVIIQSLNMEGLLGKIGVRDVTIKRGEEKDILSPFRELTPEERTMLQGVVDEMYERFLDVVSEGRGMDREQLEEVSGGAIFTGTQALANGLVDEIGYRDLAIDRARRLAGLETATVIEYRRVYSLFDLFRGRLFRIPDAPAGFDFRQFFQPQTPRLLYLWTI